MFRYFGLHWNPASPAQDAVARQMEESIARAPEWQSALSSPGLRVFTTGARAGINGAYPILLDQGVVLGRLFRRKGDSLLSQEFSLSTSQARRILDTDGRALVDDHWGRYVAVLRSTRLGCCLLRDPSGALPCHLRSIDGVSVFFSWLEDMFAFTPAWPVPRVSWDAISALIAFGKLGGSATALEGIEQVLPGRLATLAEGAPALAPMWSALDFARRRVDPEQDVAAAELRRVVTDCVVAWSSCYDSILLRLSGGVDSAIVLGSLRSRPSGTRVTCLNYHSPGSDSDERGFARLAACQAGTELVEMERDATYRLDGILAASRMPSPPAYVGRMETSRIDADVAASSEALAMFTGSGGDQIFFQQRCTSPAADYLSVHGFGRGFIEASMDSARLARVSLWQSMRRAWADQGPCTLKLDGMRQFFKLARADALEGLQDPARYAHPDLYRASDLPIGKFDHFQALVEPPGYYDPYLGEGAPELVNPLISQPLLELALTLPTWLLTQGGRGRALARQAFAQVLPREIANRQSKGGMEEHIMAILKCNLPLARRLLLDGALVSRGLLDRSKVEAALAGRVSGIGAYVGEIHHYLSIEAWLLGFPESSPR